MTAATRIQRTDLAAPEVVRVPQTDSQLTTLGEIHRALSAMTDVSEVKEARDRAEAIRTYCQRARKGLAAQNEAAYVKILAERRAGELLSQVERQQGKRNGGSELQSIVARSGIAETTAKRWQILAQLPAKRLTALVNDIADSLTSDNPEELTSSMVLVAATSYVREQRTPEPQREEPEPEPTQPTRREAVWEPAEDDPQEPDDPNAHRVAVMQNVARLLKDAMEISDEIEELRFVARDLRQLYPRLERKINGYR